MERLAWWFFTGMPSSRFGSRFLNTAFCDCLFATVLAAGAFDELLTPLYGSFYRRFTAFAWGVNFAD